MAKSGARRETKFTRRCRQAPFNLFLPYFPRNSPPFFSRFEIRSSFHRFFWIYPVFFPYFVSGNFSSLAKTVKSIVFLYSTRDPILLYLELNHRDFTLHVFLPCLLINRLMFLPTDYRSFRSRFTREAVIPAAFEEFLHAKFYKNGTRR